MDCILFRHGIAADREAWDGPDADRPLVPRGIEKTRKAAGGLHRLDVMPDLMLSSPYTRAIETAKLVQEALRFKGNLRICDELVPEAPPEKLLVLLSSLPPDAFLVCVGHEPHLGETAGVMLFGRTVAGLSLKKAGACLIAFDGPPRAGQGALHWWLTPALLRDLRKG